jgi:CubicO group peptidase (beta-lactamase class C family)
LRWTPEQQIIGYRQRERIDPVRAVGSGADFRRLPLSIQQISPNWDWQGKAMDVDSYMALQRTSGVAVLKNRQLILERYGLGRTSQDRWVSASIAKSITAILLGAAIEDGFIRGMDSFVTDYIPGLQGSAYDGVTIYQLMTMTTGIKWNEDYTDPNSDDAQILSSPYSDGIDPVVAYMRKLPRAFEPGTKFQYKTGDSNVAGTLVANAVGRSLSEYLSEKVWQPFGMEQDAFWMVNSGGREYGGFGLIMTLRDYARVGQFMLEGGKAGGRQVLPSDWLADSTTAHVALPATTLGPIGYGYHWWIYRNGYAALGHSGQAIHVFPDDNVVIAINSAWYEPNLPEYGQAQDVFVQALRKAAVPCRCPS